jgi:hypothetical protein
MSDAVVAAFFGGTIVALATQPEDAADWPLDTVDTIGCRAKNSEIHVLGDTHPRNTGCAFNAFRPMRWDWMLLSS